MQLGAATLELGLDQALELGGRALSLAETSGRALLVSVALEAEALVLGALQREASVRELRPSARGGGRARRRLSTGTEAELEGPALYHALALPGVSSLYPDASPRTLLNRNLRALLRGYAGAGIPLRYFGTEVLALLGHPVALVGYEKAESGAILIECLLGLTAPCVVRPALQREAPAALFAVLKQSPAPLDLLQRVTKSVAERLDATLVDIEPALASAAGRAPADVSTSPIAARIAVPIGVLEVALEPQLGFTGDLLVGTPALRRVEALAREALASGAPASEALLAPLKREPLDGARPSDLLAVLRAALG